MTKQNGKVKKLRKVDESTHKAWTQLREHGDAKKIAKASGWSIVSVNNALNNHHCPSELQMQITSYFDNKVKAIKASEEVAASLLQAA